MTSTDIVRIINACKESGVSSLAFGGLELSFGVNEPVNEAKWETTPPVMAFPVDNITPLTHNEITNEENDEEEDELLSLSDPLAWEKRQLNG